MNRTPPSSVTTVPAGNHLADELPLPRVEAGVPAEKPFDELACATGVAGAEPVAYCLRSSSQRASRSWRSWLGRRRLRAGAGVLGVHVTPALRQLEQGVLRSHFILRCWHSTQARTLGCLCARGTGFVDISRKPAHLVEHASSRELWDALLMTEALGSVERATGEGG
jgi:hypothetical protein